MLTVLERETKEKGKPLRWLCQCECGKKKAIQGISLRSGKSKSCGCRPKRKAHLRVVCGDGEMRTIRQISERTGIRCVTLRKRLNQSPNITYKELTRQPKTQTPRRDIACNNGKVRTLRQIAERTGIRYTTLCRRTRNNPDITYKELVRKPKTQTPRRGIACNDGKVRTLRQIAERTGISYFTLWGRLNDNPDITYKELVRKQNTRTPKSKQKPCDQRRSH